MFGESKGKGVPRAEEEDRTHKAQHFDSYFRNLEGKLVEMKKEINEMPKNV